MLQISKAAVEQKVTFLSYKEILKEPGVYTPLCNKDVTIIITKQPNANNLFIQNGELTKLEDVWGNEKFIKSGPVAVTFSNG